MKLTIVSSRQTVAAVCASGLLAISGLNADTLTWNTGAGTWNTSAANWTSTSGPSAWVQGSDAVFTGFGAATSITVAPGMILNSLTLTGTTSTLNAATINFLGSGATLDVSTINTGTVTGSSTTSIDMNAVLTGNHGLTLTTTATNSNSAGRLNLKTQSTYTGDTVLSSNSYLLSDWVSNALPTGTTLIMSTGSILRINKVNITQEIAGLSGAGTVQASSSGNTLTIRTKSGVTTAYSGSISSSTGLNLAIAGSGTQTLSGSNLNYNGTTTVSSGTLLLEGSLNTTSSVTVSGGTLNSNLSNVNLGAGAVSMSAGTIDINGSAAGKFTLAAGQNFTTTGGAIKFDLGTGTDQIAGSGIGTFSLTDTALALTLGAGFSYANTYTLFSGFTSGSLSGVSISGYDTSNYSASLNNAGVLSFTAVPEPSTMALGAIGVALIAFRLRRRTA